MFVVSAYYWNDSGLEVPPAFSDKYYGNAVLATLLWLIFMVSKSE
jgi:hypothetical protein